MCSRTNVIVLMLLLTLIIARTSALAKEVPFSFYPEQYARLSESDWAAMKSTIEAVLAVKPNEYIDDALASDALFTIARASRIRWTDGMRPEVADHLLHVVSRILSQEGKVAGEPTAIETDARRRLVQRAIWCYGEVAVSLDRQKIVEIWSVCPKKSPKWNDEIRGALLDVLNRRFLDAAVPEIAAALLEDGGAQATQSERDAISRVVLKRTVATSKSQSEAWKYIWSASKPADVRQVCTSEFRLQWYQRILVFKSVFNDPDERVPFALAEASQDVFEKYVLLYSSVFLANMKLGANKPIDDDFLGRLETAAKKVMQQASSQSNSDAVKGYSDYLKDATDSMRTNVAKRRDEANQRGGARGDEGGTRAPTDGEQRKPVAPPTANPKGVDQTPKFSGPEDRGEDFAKLATEELVRRLAAAKDVGEQRKSAKVLGDRAIQQSLNLQDAEKQMLERYIAAQLLRTASNKGDERQEAIAQLQRLWRLSAAHLLDSLGHANLSVQEAAIKNLCLMRDESIIKELIGRVEASGDANFRQGAVFAMGMMREKRKPIVPDRNVLDDAASNDLAERLIIPFLDRIEATDADPAMKKIVANAKKFLNSPFDARPRIGAKAAEKNPAEPNAVQSAGRPAVVPAARNDTMSKLSKVPETSSSPRPYLLAGIGSALVLAGAVWFGYRRLRKAK